MSQDNKQAIRQCSTCDHSFYETANKRGFEYLFYEGLDKQYICKNKHSKKFLVKENYYCELYINSKVKE